MRTIKINRSRTGETFYGVMVGTGPRNSVRLDLDQTYQINGFTFKAVSVDVDSGATIVADMPGVLSDEFMVETHDIPRLQEYHCLAMQ